MKRWSFALGLLLRVLAVFVSAFSLGGGVRAQEAMPPMESMSGHEPMPHPMKRISMTGMYGPYAMSREASGTSWQPDSTPHEGFHAMPGEWMVMAHGFANAVYDRQGGRRGDEMFLNESMLMVMAQRPLAGGTVGLRSMASLDPAMGARGYPLLFQTGETADGRTGLVDRQHPHDLFMELAATYSHPLGEERSVFGYVGLPGEPALGPPPSCTGSPAWPIPRGGVGSLYATPRALRPAYGTPGSFMLFVRVKLV